MGVFMSKRAIGVISVCNPLHRKGKYLNFRLDFFFHWHKYIFSARDTHMGLCIVNKPQLEVYPSAEKESGRLKPWIEFSDHDNQYMLPLFAVWVSFEPKFI